MDLTPLLTPLHAAFIHMSLPFSAGALYSTTEDLLRLELGLFGGKLLSAESLEKMTTPFKGDYGLGLHINTIHGRQRIFHGGGIEGFNTYLAYYPNSKITIITLANLNNRLRTSWRHLRMAIRSRSLRCGGKSRWILQS